MPYKLKEFICPVCGKKFERRAKKAHYCSRACQNTDQKTGRTPGNKKYYPIKCPTCKKEFTPYNSRIKYCSRRCGRIGKKPWNKGKKYLKIRGENHPNWKGGISKKNKTERQIAMQTVEYKNWRREVFERDNYTCVKCEQVGGKLDADHIKSWAKYPELRYEISNGRTLCKKCHKKTDTYGYKKL